MLKMKCQLCNKEVKNLKSLSTHIQFKHENKKKEYYDAYLKKKSEGTCKCCGKESPFTILNLGYSVYCNKACVKIDYAKEKAIHNPMHSANAKLNQYNTNMSRYGVSQNTKRPEIKEQIKATNQKLYGCNNVSQNEKIKAKAKENREKTIMNRYGVKSAFSIESIKLKICFTNFKRYGVSNPMQVSEIFERAQRNGKRSHKYNNVINYRGSYEKDFLDRFLLKFPDIINAKKKNIIKIYMNIGISQIFSYLH
jgi:hypothetical protein